MALQYLTVQDVLWINLQVTGRPQEFRYADLEEATFYQYAYGDSKSLLPQAARFIAGFLMKKPLAAGNEATAFVACLAFLKVNGYEFKGSDAGAWFKNVQSGMGDPLKAIEEGFSHAEHAHHLDIRAAINEVMAQQRSAIDALATVPA